MGFGGRVVGWLSGSGADMEPQNWHRHRRCVDLCNIDVDAAKSHLAGGRKLFGLGSNPAPAWIWFWSGRVGYGLLWAT